MSDLARFGSGVVENEFKKQNSVYLPFDEVVGCVFLGNRCVCNGFAFLPPREQAQWQELEESFRKTEIMLFSIIQVQGNDVLSDEEIHQKKGSPLMG